MLDRIALHQTRLRTPGLALDAKGVALGAKGLVLLASLDRLVGFLALYTREASLAELLGSLTIEVVQSKLGAREVALSFAADGSERMDRVGEVARLAGGYVFTGTKRHFVQYRDAAAPFGYDVREIAATEAPLALYHTSFSQHYQPVRRLELAPLLLRLQPQLAPAEGRTPGPRWICAEAGLGPALVHYFVRSQVEAAVGLAEWPPASEFEPTPLRRYLFKLERLPERMAPLLESTPGLGVFVPAGPGAAVEVGFRHPVQLRACPVFAPEGLVLLRGRGREPLCIDRLPTFGSVTAFARVALGDPSVPIARGTAGSAVPTLALPLRLAPDTQPWCKVTASLVRPDQLGLLRLLAYRLGRRPLGETTVAFTQLGAVLLREQGVETIPVGELFEQVHPQIFVSAGHTAVPAVAPEVLFRALGSPPGDLLFLLRDGQRVGVPKSAFVPLEQALLTAESWTKLGVETIAPALALPLPQVSLESPGLRPMPDLDTGLASGTGQSGPGQGG